MADPVLIHAGNARAAARKHRVRVEHIMGILSVEGGTSEDGKPVKPGDGLGPPSYGQFITATGAALGVKYGDSASETDAIARYLNQLGYQKDPKRAIAAYNGGPGNPQYTYADKVINAAKRYVGADGPASPAASPSAPARDTGALGIDVRSGATRALLWTVLVAAGVALAVMGASRAAGMGVPA